jgi:hypothetical protein
MSPFFPVPDHILFDIIGEIERVECTGGDGVGIEKEKMLILPVSPFRRLIHGLKQFLHAIRFWWDPENNFICKKIENQCEEHHKTNKIYCIPFRLCERKVFLHDLPEITSHPSYFTSKGFRKEKGFPIPSDSVSGYVHLFRLEYRNYSIVMQRSVSGNADLK